MFLPIGDDNPREKKPYVTYALIALNVVMFIAFCLPQPNERLMLVPSQFSVLTLFTSMFMHAGLLHIAGNMLFLWIFGDNVEDKLGHFAYLVFYLAAGAAAAFLHIAMATDLSIRMLGASGAISGVIAAYAVFFPHNRVKMLIWVFIFINVVQVPAIFWIGFWFLLQVFFGVLSDGQGGVAYFAHIGGFLAGLAVAFPWKYILFPRRFGLHSAAEPYPAELVAASRTGNRPPPVRTPFVTIEKDGVEFVEQEPHTRFAILRANDDLAHLHDIAGTVQEETGIPSGKTIERLRSTRGIVASGLDRAAAERIHVALRRVEVRTLMVPDDRSTRPPDPARPQTFTWNGLSFSYLYGDEIARVLWPMPFLYLAALPDGRPIVDIFVSPRSRVRLTEETSLRFVDAERRAESTATLRDLAAAIIDLRRGAALNDGVRVLASRGTWGWLTFRSEAEYEEYAFWAYNVILARQPLYRF